MSKTSNRVLQWVYHIEGIRGSMGLSEIEYPTSLVLAFIHVESSGYPVSSSDSGTHLGLFNMNNDYIRNVGLSSANQVQGNPQLAISTFFKYNEIPTVKRRHGLDPFKMYIQHNLGGTWLNKYLQELKINGEASARKLVANAYLPSAEKRQKKRKTKLDAADQVVRLTIAYAKRLGEDRELPPPPPSDYSWSATEHDTYYGKERSTREVSPLELLSFYTPEEMRKGIIAQIYYINDWHLTQLANSEKEKTRQEKEEDQAYTPTDSRLPIADMEVGADDENQTRGDGLVDERRRYVQSFVEAEFYRRRYATRSIPVTSGPFNPYPVAGFPGLVMNPRRPVLGYITSVSHNINPAAGSGTTAVSMSSVRYWDEGEVWYWFGGEEHDNYVMRNFPQWHNRYVVPTNNCDSGTFVKDRFSNLDNFYRFMLDSEAIEYSSNHVGLVDPDLVKKAIKDRDPGGLDVNPETLDIREYNQAIGEKDSNGRYLPGTLAHRFFGPINPYDVIEGVVSVEEQISYVERYGVRERELLVDFLGNEFKRVPSNGKLVLTGPTFGGDRLNSIQNHILEYMDDLEKRTLSGGV